MAKTEKRVVPIETPIFKVAGHDLAPRDTSAMRPALDALNQALAAFEATEISWEDGDRQVRKTQGQSLKLSLVVRIEAAIN